MAVVKELNNTRYGSFDSTGEAERTRAWVIYNVHPNGIDKNTVHVLYPPIPATGTPYDVGSALILDRYDIGLFEDGVSTVLVGIYTTSRIGRLPVPPAIAANGQISWTWRPQTVVVEIPYGRFDKFVDMANPTANFSAWTIQKVKVYEQRQIWTLRVSGAFVSQSALADGLALCGLQANKIHLIRGKSMRYIPGGANQIGTALEWEITHEWEFDPGSRTIPNPAPLDPGKFSMPPTLSIPSGGFIRAPFYRLEAYNAPNPKTTHPKYAAVLPYTFEDNGWQGLPGMPGSL